MFPSTRIFLSHGSAAALEDKRSELIGKGVEVTDVVDHEWARSINFKDPNGITLEYCFLTRDVGTDEDVTMQERFERSVERLGQGDPDFLRRVRAEMVAPAPTPL